MNLITVRAQSPTFFHLATSDGLSDNNVSSLAIDKKGLLWIGTLGGGVNVFNGYEVVTYNKKIRPQIASDYVIHLTCDKNNRIWLGTPEGISWVDDSRIFHRVTLNDTIQQFASRTILDTDKYGPVLYTSYGQFFFNVKTKRWKELPDIPEELEYEQFSDAEIFEGDKYIFATRKFVMIYDYSNGGILFRQPFEQVVSVCRYSNHEIAIALRNGYLKIVDINTNTVTKEFTIHKPGKERKVKAILIEARPASNGSLLLTTEFDGLIVIDRKDSIHHFVHDPIDRGSIGSNLTRRVICSPDGDVVVGSSIAGVSTFDITSRRAGYTSIFSDGKGKLYDNYIADITEDKKGTLWLGAYEKLIKWDKQSNSTDFFEYYSREDGVGYELRAVCIDSLGRKWVGSLGNGVAILNETTGRFDKIKIDTTGRKGKLRGPALRNDLILDMQTMSDGTVWVASVGGIYTVNPNTLVPDEHLDDSLLKQLSGKRVNYFLEDSKGRIWMAMNTPNVYCYDKAANKMTHYSSAEGLAGRCFAAFEDSRKNIYIATTVGFTIIYPDGKLKNYNLADGLKYDRCDGMLEDEQGRIWVSNIKCLVMFDPKTGEMKVYDQNVGLSAEGFRPGAFWKTRNGELLWGSRKGVNYFYPSQLTTKERKLNVTITEADMNDSVVYLSKNNRFRLKYSKNSILLRFTAINLHGSENIHYRFMLENRDETWQEGIDVREARYSFIPPGKYRFKVEASTNDIDWVAAENQIEINVIPPVWQQWWFILLSVALISGGAFLMIQNRNKKLEEKKEAQAVLLDTKRKMTEVEMQALRAQMNPHFIFNCLNSINRYIVKSDQTTASFYLTKFAKLIRLILDNSNSKNVILTNELEALKLYIEMEALRFDKKFSYEVKVEDHLSTDSIEVPPLIIQPYVENAIWHGLLHKEQNGHLSIRVSMIGDSLLQCIIEDNGIGRAKAKELKSKSATSRKSLGMELTEHRLNLLNKHAVLNASVEIIDKTNGHDEPLGTKVIIRIPV